VLPREGLQSRFRAVLFLVLIIAPLANSRFYEHYLRSGYLKLISFVDDSLWVLMVCWSNSFDGNALVLSVVCSGSPLIGQLSGLVGTSLWGQCQMLGRLGVELALGIFVGISTTQGFMDSI